MGDFIYVLSLIGVAIFVIISIYRLICSPMVDASGIWAPLRNKLAKRFRNNK